MLLSPDPISRRVRYEIARRIFFLEERLRWASKDNNMAILSEANLASFRKIEETV